MSKKKHHKQDRYKQERIDAERQRARDERYRLRRGKFGVRGITADVAESGRTVTLEEYRRLAGQ